MLDGVADIDISAEQNGSEWVTHFAVRDPRYDKPEPAVLGDVQSGDGQFSYVPVETMALAFDYEAVCVDCKDPTVSE